MIPSGYEEKVLKNNPVEFELSHSSVGSNQVTNQVALVCSAEWHLLIINWSSVPSR